MADLGKPAKLTPDREPDDSGAPPEIKETMGGQLTMDEQGNSYVDSRALGLSDDAAGGYAVPYQLDGTKKKAPKKRK